MSPSRPPSATRISTAASKFPNRPTTATISLSKPAWQRRRKDETEVPPSRRVTPWNPRRPDRFMDYYRAIAAVDDGVGRIYRQLEKMGALENTVIAFAGDNGYFSGEHNGRGDKRLFYEESIRIPFLMRYPREIPAGSTIPEMALNIDLAQTLLEIRRRPRPPRHAGPHAAPPLPRQLDGLAHELALRILGGPHTRSSPA